MQNRTLQIYAGAKMLQQISVLLFINYFEPRSLLELDKLKLKMYPMLTLNL